MRRAFEAGIMTTFKSATVDSKEVNHLYAKMEARNQRCALAFLVARARRLYQGSEQTLLQRLRLPQKPAPSPCTRRTS